MLLYPNILYSLALCTFFKEMDHYEKKSLNVRENILKHSSTLLEDVKTMNIHEKQDSYFWLTLAVILYPKVLASILEITELEK